MHSSHCVARQPVVVTPESDGNIEVLLITPAAGARQYCMSPCVIQSPDSALRGPGAPCPGRRRGPVPSQTHSATCVGTSGQLDSPHHIYQRPQAHALGHASCKPHICSALCPQALKNVSAPCSTNALMFLSRTPRGTGVSQRQQHALWATANPALDPKHPSCRAWCWLAQSLHAVVDTATHEARARDRLNSPTEAVSY